MLLKSKSIGPCAVITVLGSALKPSQQFAPGGLTAYHRLTTHAMQCARTCLTVRPYANGNRVLPATAAAVQRSPHTC